MPLSAWLMLIFGILILYGGLALCLGVAHRNRGKADPAERTGGDLGPPW